MKKRLIDLYSDVSSFTPFLKKIRDAVGKDDDDNFILWNSVTEDQLTALDTDYYLGRRSRYVSTLLNYAVETSSPKLVLDSIVARFSDNWKRLFDSYFGSEYNPVHNYDMTETRTPDLSETIDSSQNAKTTSNSGASVYGFNSEEAVPTNEADSSTESLQDNNFQTSTKTNTGTETKTRSGNIGVMSSQKLLLEEIELRKFEYWKKVFEDIDLVLVRGMW